MAAGEAQLLFELRNVGYDGPFLDQNYANTAILAGTQSGEFQDVVIWLTEEIRVLGKLDERITKSEDSNTFVWELSSFLKELTCPYTSLTVGHVSDRLQTLEAKLLLLDYLVNELMALKMLEALKPKEKSTVITLHESPTAAALKDICITLGMGKPPNNVPPKMLFEKINSHLDDMVRNEGESRLSKPLFNPKERLTGDQWAKLERIQKELDHEYDLRRKMLLTRLDVTIQSFRWSNRAKDKEGTIAERYAEKRKILDALQAGGRDTDIAALLAARETLAIIEKTSSATVRKNTKSKIQRHIIGLVPDRGGRAYEHKAPALEMPSWQTQRSTGGGGGGGRGGFGGGRGGRGGGGGFQQQHSNYPNKGYNQGNGNGGQGFYQGGRGGYNNQGGGGNLASSSGGGGYYQGGGGGGGHNQNRGGRVQGGWSQSQQDYNHSGYGSGSSRGSFGGDQQQQHYSGNSSGNSRGNYGSGGGYSDRGGYGDNRNSYDNNDYNTRGGGGRGRSNYNRGGRR